MPHSVVWCTCFFFDSLLCEESRKQTSKQNKPCEDAYTKKEKEAKITGYSNVTHRKTLLESSSPMIFLHPSHQIIAAALIISKCIIKSQPVIAVIFLLYVLIYHFFFSLKNNSQIKLEFESRKVKLERVSFFREHWKCSMLGSCEVSKEICYSVSLQIFKDYLNGPRL